jgi:hypothetical protein
MEFAMGIFTPKPSPDVSREQLLAARPLRHPAIESTADPATGELTLKLPRRRTWWLNLFARFGAVGEFRLLTIDRVGSSVWNLCDGEHTVQDLVSRLADEHKLPVSQAEASMMTYLKQLSDRGLLALALDSDARPENGPDHPVKPDTL